MSELSQFRCKRCLRVVVPPRIPVCEIAQDYGSELKFTVSFSCECGERISTSIDSKHCNFEPEKVARKSL